MKVRYCIHLASCKIIVHSLIVVDVMAGGEISRHSGINSFLITEHRPTPKLQKSNICCFQRRGMEKPMQPEYILKYAQNHLLFSNLFIL